MSSGFLYGENEPSVPCPFCKTDCLADFVDIGVGYQQCGPYHCDQCGASEIGPYDNERELSEQEKAVGWYASNSEPGSSANVIGGKAVSYKQVEQAYRQEFKGNPLWEDKSYVANWWERLRRG